jgi:hypothetical protein
MKIAACGMACEVCGRYVRKECDGCASGIEEEAPVFLEKLKGMGFSCPVLDCAIKSKVAYCLKDCEKFPCEVHYQEFPYSKKLLDIFKA